MIYDRGSNNTPMNEKELRKEIVELTKELIRKKTVNPPGNEYLCRPLGPFAISFAAIKLFLRKNPKFKGTIYLLAVADEERGSGSSEPEKPQTWSRPKPRPRSTSAIPELRSSIPHLVPKDSLLVQKFLEAAKDLNLSMKLGTMGGNTVGKDFFFKGTEVISHYPCTKDVCHIANEYVEIENMVKCAQLYAKLLEKLLVLDKPK